MSTIAPPNPTMIPARWHGGDQTPKVIVMHGTVSPCVRGGARATAHFFATEDNKTSAHYVRDPYETIQCVPDHTVAYHCGHNQDSIGYELCDPQSGAGSRWADEAHTLMLAGAAKDVARLCLAYGIPAVKIGPADLIDGKHGICGHVDETNAFHQSTHTDPGDAFPWPRFIALVKSEIVKLKGGTSVPSKPAPPVAHTHLVEQWSAHRSITLHDVSLVQKTDRQPFADAAYRLHKAVEAAWDAYKAEVNK